LQIVGTAKKGGISDFSRQRDKEGKRASCSEGRFLVVIIIIIII
jgi:hypothetical protein